MKVNFSTTAKADVAVQGINVALSSEYQGNEIPKFVTANCNGYIQNEGQTNDKVYTNASLKYDVETKDFASINGANVSQSLINSIVPLIEEFHTAILAERGGVE